MQTVRPQPGGSAEIAADVRAGRACG